MEIPYSQNVFINCPFDPRYKHFFEAIVFAVFDCGFQPRCALEIDDGGQIRIEKIFGIISECKLGIHDISMTELDESTDLPRFNMPLELGIFLGAKRYGRGEQREKVCLILDRDHYRYQKFISDISGQDIRAHNGDLKLVIPIIRNWLRSSTPRTTLPGGDKVAYRYEVFRAELPTMCEEAQMLESELTFSDYAWLISEWQKT
ncbi:MAG: hypothetical protein ACJ76N_04940 [Thermoanaerobaculia bacterium]